MILLKFWEIFVFFSETPCSIVGTIPAAFGKKLILQVPVAFALPTWRYIRFVVYFLHCAVSHHSSLFDSVSKLLCIESADISDGVIQYRVFHKNNPFEVCL